MTEYTSGGIGYRANGVEPEYAAKSAKPSRLLAALMAGLTLTPPQPAAAQCPKQPDPTLVKIAQYLLINGEPTRPFRRVGADRNTGNIVDVRVVRQYRGFVEVDDRIVNLVLTDGGERGPDRIVDCHDTIDFLRGPPMPFTEPSMGDEVTDKGLNGMGNALDFAHLNRAVYDPRKEPPCFRIDSDGQMSRPNPNRSPKELRREQQRFKNEIDTAYRDLAGKVSDRLDKIRPGTTIRLPSQRY